MTTYYLNIPELVQKSINNTILGNGQNSNIVTILQHPISDDEDRNRIHLQNNTVFNELTVYFTDQNGNEVAFDDFVVTLDLIKKADKIY